MGSLLFIMISKVITIKFVGKLEPHPKIEMKNKV